MIILSNEYKKYIVQAGVGRNDKKASSPNSYISYLQSVSVLIGKDISPDLISNKKDIDSIMKEVEGQKAPKTLNNYRTALNRYLEFVINYWEKEE